MADIFFSYASDDRSTVEQLVPRLEAQGYSVWWDRQLKVGASFDKQIEKEIEQSSCVLVLWSSHSLDSDWVRAEAGEGLESGRLVQLLLGDLRPPLVFRQQQAFRLEEDSNQELSPLLEALTAACSVIGPSNRTAAVSQSLWLIADIENRTNEPLFNGSLAKAIEIGIDHLSEVFLYPRDALLSLGNRYQVYLAAAEPLAQREGLNFLLGGDIDSSAAGFSLTLELVDLSSGSRSRSSVTFTDPHEVLAVLADQLAAILDPLLDFDPQPVCKPVRSLDMLCLFEDGLAEACHAEHDTEAAVRHFERALVADPTFVPSQLGLAIAYDSLGRAEEGRRAIETTLDYLAGLSEREQLRTQVLYYLFHSEDHHKVLEHTEALLEISPLEVSAINNQALARCSLLDFDGAVQSLSRAVALAPDEAFYQVNLALYCMYAGQLERAIDLADGIVAAGHDIFDAHIARCCSLFALGEVDRSLAGFRELADRDVWYADSARLGLADGLLAAGKADQAGEVLRSIQLAEKGDQRSETARLMLAEVALELGREAEALDQLASLEASATDPRIMVAVALLGAKLGASALVERISQRLKRHIDPQSRAYTLMVEGLGAQLRGDFSQAERAFKDAIAALDLWMIHCVLADFYQSLNMVLEARLERAICIGRPGEGVTAYINRLPSCRYLARMMDNG